MVVHNMQKSYHFLYTYAECAMFISTFFLCKNCVAEVDLITTCCQVDSIMLLSR